MAYNENDQARLIEVAFPFCCVNANEGSNL